MYILLYLKIITLKSKLKQSSKSKLYLATLQFTTYGGQRANIVAIVWESKCRAWYRICCVRTDNEISHCLIGISKSSGNSV